MATQRDKGRGILMSMDWVTIVIYIALLGLGFMRVRRHSMKSSLAFAAGILGMIIVLSLIKYVFY